MDSSKSTSDGCISRGPSELADLPPELEPASIPKLIVSHDFVLELISIFSGGGIGVVSSYSYVFKIFDPEEVCKCFKLKRYCSKLVLLKK